MLVVDTSDSMNEDDGRGTIKIEGAKRALLNVLDGLPVTALVGLRAYPGRVSCSAGLTYGLTAPTDEGLRNTVRTLKADRDTPTALALRAAAADVLSLGRPATIVLVSDGQSNCGGDPCEAAKRIVAEGVDITVNTVGFQISDRGADELRCIAQATTGRYFDAGDADALQRSIDEAATPRLSLTIDEPNSGAVFGAGSLVTVAVTVRNVSALRLDDVRTQLSFPSAKANQPTNVDPGVVGAIRYLGNLASGEIQQVRWQYRVHPRHDGASSTMVVHATAANASPHKAALTIRYADRLELTHAGPLLKQAQHPAILGDSYSSGEGAGDYLIGTDVPGANQCHRSKSTYAMTLSWPHEPTLLACSGATTAEITDPNLNNHELAQADRLAWVDSPVDLVLLTIGGNDVGFADVTTHCVLTPSPCQNSPVYPNPALSGSCLLKYATASAWSQPSMQMPGCEPFAIPYGVEALAKIESVGPALRRAYAAIDDAVNSDDAIAARHGAVAPIVVLAYPRLMPYLTEDRGFCSRFLSVAELRFGAAFTDALNAKIKQEVAAARDSGLPILFADDVVDAFQPSHTICNREPHAAREVLWRNAVGLLESVPHPVAFAGKQQEQLHPNADGYQDMTAALVRWSNRPEVAAPVTRHRPPPYRPIALGSVSGAVLLDQAPHDAAATLRPGAMVTLQGSGYAQNVDITITVHSAPRAIGTAHSDDQGRVQVQVTVPHDLRPGTHVLIVTGLDPTGHDRLLFALVEVRRPLSWVSIVLWPLSALLVTVPFGVVWWRLRRRAVRGARPTQPYARRW